MLRTLSQKPQPNSSKAGRQPSDQEETAAPSFTEMKEAPA